MISITWHPHFDVWALIFSLIIFFEYTTDNNYLKKEKRKFVSLIIIFSNIINYFFELPKAQYSLEIDPSSL